MQLFEILFILFVGGWNFNSFKSKQCMKGIKSTFSGSDRERRNSAMPVFKFRF